jgi:hypothetical protein
MLYIGDRERGRGEGRGYNCLNISTELVFIYNEG